MARLVVVSPPMAAGIRSIPEILHDVLANIQDIVRAEVHLAKAELGEELTRARSAGLLLGAGAVAAIFSALFLLLACVYALGRVMWHCARSPEDDAYPVSCTIVL